MFRLLRPRVIEFLDELPAEVREKLFYCSWLKVCHEGYDLIEVAYFRARKAMELIRKDPSLMVQYLDARNSVFPQ
jgi:hypothetical protein